MKLRGGHISQTRLVGGVSYSSSADDKSERDHWQPGLFYKRNAEAVCKFRPLDHRRFEFWLGQWGSADYTPTATGRRLKAEVPANLAVAASQLAVAMLPLADRYALPYFRVKR